jgi:DNA polymerase III delta subunit
VNVETNIWPEPINTGALLSEIERLKALVKDRMYELEEINELKSLLSRAADALEWPGQLLGSDFRKLIAQLRKAAE